MKVFQSQVMLSVLVITLSSERPCGIVKIDVARIAASNGDEGINKRMLALSE